MWDRLKVTWDRVKVAAVFLWHGVHSPQFIAVAKWFLRTHTGLNPQVVAVLSGLIEAIEAGGASSVVVPTELFPCSNGLPETPGGA